MFIGHYGIGFAAKKAAPTVSLGTLFLAAQFLDLLWPTLVMLGIEQVRIKPVGTPGFPLIFAHYPISHSLLTAVGWSLLLGAMYYILRRHRTAAIVVGLTVLSHWLLDLIVHFPDLPIYPAGPKLGLALWAHPLASNALELAIFAVGVWLYQRTTAPVNAVGKWALWLLVIFLVVIQISNALSPPPPSVMALAWTGQAQWLLVAWGYWIDRHRRTR
ncbi:MAG TPA: hypothetical protein VKA13_06900 [Gammaproteobacteria bacterium]|nr:hypothetical protein [Gammaproteobacteria bacterium]